LCDLLTLQEERITIFAKSNNLMILNMYLAFVLYYRDSSYHLLHDSYLYGGLEEELEIDGTIIDMREADWSVI
jgi:hypothetical protein